MSFCGPSNSDRAEWARIVLDTFADAHVQKLDIMDVDSVLEVIGDFIADLLHLLDRSPVEWEDVWDRANFHYAEELAE